MLEFNDANVLDQDAQANAMDYATTIGARAVLERRLVELDMKGGNDLVEAAKANALEYATKFKGLSA